MGTHLEQTDATRRAIREAFWQLYRQLPIERITVNLLAQEAGVHRSTFYRYYQDVYAVLEELERELMNRFLEDIRTIFREHPDLTVEQFALLSMERFRDNAEQLYCLLGKGGDAAFKERLISSMQPFFRKLHHLGPESPRQDYYRNMFTDFLLNSFNFWYEHRETCSLEEVNRLSQPILDGLLRGIHGEESPKQDS